MNTLSSSSRRERKGLGSRIARFLLVGRVSKIAFIMAVIFVILSIAISLDLRGYKSGDEIGFLTGFADRGGEDTFDLRYFAWVFYIMITSEIFPSLPLLINFAFLCYLAAQLTRYSSIPLWSVMAMVLLPTVFYFFNTYLRDVVFLLFSISIILYFIKIKNNFIKSLFWIFFVLSLLMRPIYGIFFIMSYILSASRIKKYYIFICVCILIVMFITAPILVLSNENIYLLYKDFFIYGHVRDKDFMTVMMIPTWEFNQTAAAKNILFSPLYFWFIPTEGFGSRYDMLLYAENFLLFLAMGYGLFRLKGRRWRWDRAYRISLLMLVFSCVMAAATTTHGDVYRFRLMFLPFLFYFAFAGFFIAKLSSFDVSQRTV